MPSPPPGGAPISAKQDRAPGRGRARVQQTDTPRTGRALARQVLARVTRDGAFANRALAAALDRAPQLSPPERGLATELVYGVLRRRARLDRALDAVATRGLSVPDDVRNVLRVGAYQLLFLDRVPAYAAVDDTVETMKREHGPRLGGLANALLRRLAERGEPPLPDPAREPRAYLLDACGFPPWMADLCLRELGQARAVALGTASGEVPPVALRTNRLAGLTRAALLEALAAERPGAALAPSPVDPRRCWRAAWTHPRRRPRSPAARSPSRTLARRSWPSCAAPPPASASWMLAPAWVARPRTWPPWAATPRASMRWICRRRSCARPRSSGRAWGPKASRRAPPT